MAGLRALRSSALLGLLLLSPHALNAAPSSAEKPASSAPAAFGIVAVDSIRQEWGVATVSRWIAVGARSIDARAGGGAWLALELPDPRAAAAALLRSARSALLASAIAPDEAGSPAKPG